MLKLKTISPSHAIKNGSFETWVLAVVSTVKAVGAESALPSYMCPAGVNNTNGSSSSSLKSKEKGKIKSEDEIEKQYEHQTQLSTIVLKWTDFVSN